VPACSLLPDMPLRLRKRTSLFEVPVEHMVLRINGPEDLYEEARAVGMHFWEQIQSFSVRHPLFSSSKRPLAVPEDAPPIIREMAELSGLAGVGPMFAFRGALTEFVGRKVGERLREVMVSCGGDHYVLTRRRARLAVQNPTGERGSSLAIVVKPELGPQGIYTTVGNPYFARGMSDGLVVVATSCIVADAAAAGASAILGKPGGLGVALRYLKGISGVHGAVVFRGDRIGVAGSLELAA
jgi:ApbE superfamily uncharacterized protein (UPF0280 family)